MTITTMIFVLLTAYSLQSNKLLFPYRDSTKKAYSFGIIKYFYAEYPKNITKPTDRLERSMLTKNTRCLFSSASLFRERYFTGAVNCAKFRPLETVDQCFPPLDYGLRSSSFFILKAYSFGIIKYFYAEYPKNITKPTDRLAVHFAEQ